MWLRKGNFKREIESLLIVAQNNAIRTNHIKARLDKTQQHSKCRLCGERDETTSRECNKLVQKYYKTRHDWVGKVIYWKLCKKFDHTTKLYILFTNPSARAGYDTRSIFKRSLTGLNSEFSFS